MLRVTRGALAAKLDARRLLLQIEPNPLRGWKAYWATKLAIDEEGRKAAIHNENVYNFGPDYNTMNEDNFVYPLFYGMAFIIMSLYMFGWITYGDPATNLPWQTYNPKNKDGTTQMPLEPQTPHPFFTKMVEYRD